MTESTPSATRHPDRIPILLESTLIAGKLLVVVVTAAVIGISMAMHCDVFTITLRGFVALLATGAIAWGGAFLVARGTIAAARSQLMHVREREAPASLLNKQV